jgi:hypothetical protein
MLTFESAAVGGTAGIVEKLVVNSMPAIMFALLNLGASVVSTIPKS